eukprot:TRINITY_DN2535_c0_g3_i2.p1 TRINITY_DN2535_c0_g3~~TRINITY_DN2535_c0_g3_i2.p1  ORF type:complete len:650 (-),score=138.27 TRINITY_DN2535_c0_g3_i2:1894-3843(-)
MDEDCDDLLQQLRLNTQDLAQYDLGSFSSWHEQCIKADAAKTNIASSRMSSAFLRQKLSDGLQNTSDESAKRVVPQEIDTEFSGLISGLEASLARNRGAALSMGMLSTMSRPYSEKFNQDLEEVVGYLRSRSNISTTTSLSKSTNIDLSVEDELDKLVIDVKEEMTGLGQSIQSSDTDALQTPPGLSSSIRQDVPDSSDENSNSHPPDSDSSSAHQPSSSQDQNQTESNEALLEEILQTLQQAAEDTSKVSHLNIPQTSQSVLDEVENLIGGFQQLPGCFVVRQQVTHPASATQLPRASMRSSTHTLLSSQRLDFFLPIVRAKRLVQIADVILSTYQLPIPTRDEDPTEPPSTDLPVAVEQASDPTQQPEEINAAQDADANMPETEPQPSEPKPPFPSDPPVFEFPPVPVDPTACGCGEKVTRGQVLTALGRAWHPEHFACAICKTSLLGVPFYPKDGHPICHEHFLEYSCPRCGGCGKSITAQFVTALERKWHPECFRCYVCSGPLPGGQFFVIESMPACQTCYADRNFPKCGKCAKPVVDNRIDALEQVWHADHFVCTTCEQPFPNGFFFPGPNTRPYCQKCVYAATNQLCHTCGKPIEGRCISAGGKKYHTNHFICTNCKDELNGTTCRERNGKPYCINCHCKLFD